MYKRQVFSGAIKSLSDKIEDGEVVGVYNAEREFIAYGLFHNSSRVAIRLLEWNPQAQIDADWWRARVQKAVAARQHLLQEGVTNTVRLIFAEADFLPGLIADKYADFISIQVHSVGVEKVKSVIIDELNALLQPKGIYERSDLKSREHEGLPDTNGLCLLYTSPSPRD